MKIKVYIAVILLCTFFSGCTRKTQIIESANLGGAATTDAPLIQMGDAIKTIGESYYYPETTVTENGFYELSFNGDFYSILYTDFATKSRTFLCSSVNCLHNSPECSSYVINAGFVNLFVAGEYLMLAKTRTHQESDVARFGEAALPNFERRSFSGTDAKLLKSFSSSDEIKTTMCTDGKTLVFTLSEHFEDGDGTIRTRVALYAMNIETGQLTKLCALGELEVLQGINSGGLLTLDMVFDDMSLVAGGMTDGRLNGSDTTNFYLRPFENVADKKLIYSVEGQGVWDWIVPRDNFLLQLGTQINQIDVKTHAQKTICEDFPFAGYNAIMPMSILSNKMVYKNVVITNDKPVISHFCLDFESGTVSPFELTFDYGGKFNNTMQVYAVAGSDYLVLIGFEEKVLPIQPNAPEYVGASNIFNQYALISKEDYYASVRNFQPIEDIF